MQNITTSEAWKLAIINKRSLIKDAILSLEKSGLRIIFVLDDEGKLLGTISDGDIRRGMLNSLRLEDSIQSIVQTNPIVVGLDVSRQDALLKMKSSKILQIPITDNSGNLIGAHVWDEIPSRKSLNNIMVIMAGGKGTRLESKTTNCPKPLLNVAGKPILEHIIQRARGDGFTEFIITINYLGHMIKEYFGDGHKFGVNIEYISEETPLGTAGSLGLITRQVDSPVIVTNGDLLTEINYRELIEFHTQSQSKVTVVVRGFEFQNQFGVVELMNSRIVKYVEKPIHTYTTNAGIYALDPTCLSYFDGKTPADMPDLLATLINSEEPVAAYPIHEKWIDIGRPDDLFRADESFQ